MPNKRRKSHRLQPTTRCEASSKNPHPSGSTRPATLPHPHCRPPNTTEYDESEYAALPVNHAMFPNCLCDNSVRDATYDEVYSATSNTVHINGFRCRRACSVPSLMFHRVNRTSRYPRGWFGVVGQAPLPRRGIREGDPFCGPVAYAARGWWVSQRSSFSAQSPLGAKILPVEQTIRRWRVGTGQHAS